MHSWRMVLRPLPYPDASRLVWIMGPARPKANQKDSLIAPVLLEDWNRVNRTFAAISGAYSESVTDTSGAEPERLGGLRVAPRYFQVYGTAPVIGRTCRAEEERFGGPRAAVISYGLWARRFGFDRRSPRGGCYGRRGPDAVGRAHGERGLSAGVAHSAAGRKLVPGVAAGFPIAAESHGEPPLRGCLCARRGCGGPARANAGLEQPSAILDAECAAAGNRDLDRDGGGACANCRIAIGRCVWARGGGNCWRNCGGAGGAAGAGFAGVRHRLSRCADHRGGSASIERRGFAGGFGTRAQSGPHRSGGSSAGGGGLSGFFPRQAGRIFVGALAEFAAHAGGQRDGGFAEAVAQLIGRGERLLPFLVALFADQIHLRRFGCESGGVNAEQAHGRARLPVAAEQFPRLLEEFDVQLGWAAQRMGAGDGGKIRISQFELNGAGVQAMLAEAAAHHFGEARQGGFELRGI